MIVADQPSIFPSDVLVKVSSASDGTMLNRTKGTHSHDALTNRRKFCTSLGIDYDDVVYQQIIYDGSQTYNRLKPIDKTCVSRTTPQVPADGLVTAQSGVGIMLPIADCVATVLYDPGTRQLAVLHLGRHSTVTRLLNESIKHLIRHGAEAKDIVVWMCPNAQKKSYVMQYFDQQNDPAWELFIDHASDGIHVDLAGYNRQVCLDAGIRSANIEISNVDTFASTNYFSHSRGDTTKRFAVVAMMR